MSDASELLAVCADLIRLIEGVGCRDWRDQNGQRIKDTNEWVRAYVAINKAIAEERKAKAAQPPCGADGAVQEDARRVVAGLRRATELLRRDGYHPEGYDFALAASLIERLASQPAAPIDVADVCGDCPTCEHHRGAECLSPAYRAMSHSEQSSFWDEPTPCRLWQPKEQSA